jgi:hypothetical protein
MPEQRLTLREFLNQDIGSLLGKSVRAPISPGRAKALRSSRHLAPVGAAAIKGELVCSEGKAVPVSLWDLSESGFCVVLHGPMTRQFEHPVTITLHDCSSPEQLQLFVRMCWSDRVAGTTFAGLHLMTPPSVLRQSFLGRYLQP